MTPRESDERRRVLSVGDQRLQNDDLRGNDQADSGTAHPAPATPDHTAEARPTRRTMITKGGKLLVYTAPLVQLFRPSQALAASGASPVS